MITEMILRISIDTKIPNCGEQLGIRYLVRYRDLP